MISNGNLSFERKRKCNEPIIAVSFLSTINNSMFEVGCQSVGRIVGFTRQREPLGWLLRTVLYVCVTCSRLLTFRSVRVGQLLTQGVSGRRLSPQLSTDDVITNLGTSNNSNSLFNISFWPVRAAVGFLLRIIH